MRRRNVARARLTRVLGRPGGIDIVEAAMWVAAEEYVALDVGRERARLRRLTDDAAAGIADTSNPFAQIDGLARFMFHEQEFRPDPEDYDDPRNSYLNEVVERRVGIPLTLSLIFMEMARAAGLRARGVALPGHFVARIDIGERRILVDPFGLGRVITIDDCRDLVRRSTGRPGLFRPEHLDGVPDRAVIGRLLMNLKHAYLSRSDYGRALASVERLLLVWPSAHDEVRDRGFLRAHLGQRGAAIEDLEAYLDLAPTAPDNASVRGRLAWLRRREADA